MKCGGDVGVGTGEEHDMVHATCDRECNQTAKSVTGDSVIYANKDDGDVMLEV